MGGEIALAAEAVPIATAAVGMYGKAVLAKAWDDVADVTIKAGLRVLQGVFGRKQEGDALPGVLADVVAHPDDSDVVAQFRLAIRRALEADPALAKEVSAIVGGASGGTSTSQHVVARRDAYAAGRDQNIYNIHNVSVPVEQPAVDGGQSSRDSIDRHRKRKPGELRGERSDSAKLAPRVPGQAPAPVVIRPNVPPRVPKRPAPGPGATGYESS